jgi:Ca2+-binding EF-hand superfamily protein
MTIPGKGTRDLSGPTGLTTINFVKEVRKLIDSPQIPNSTLKADVSMHIKDAYEIDNLKMKEMFDSVDKDKSGKIDFDEFTDAMKKLGIAPRKL